MLRDLPSVDKVLSHEQLRKLEGAYPHALLLDLARRQLAEARGAIVNGKPAPSLDEVATGVVHHLESLESPALRRVINATGVILHTNLGRAPLSQETRAAMERAATGYSNLEFDLGTGGRGDRTSLIEPLLCQLTGAEAALAVNNNASAVMLGLAAIARGKEVIVSRGQAVEIGGSFRIPDVMRQSGAKLVEVGTTNCTYISDYGQAITPRTAALLRVHSSNFRVIGHTHEVAIEEMAPVARDHGIALLDDLGSGCFIDTSGFGLGPEPTVQQSVMAGAGLVFFSGDKLVGGPQAGIIAGRREYVSKLRRHPLMRALRLDKVRLAGMAATLVHYLKGEAMTRIPVWRMIATPLPDIERRARDWAAVLGETASVIDGESLIGGGSLPGGTLPTRLVAIGRTRGSTPQSLERRLRRRPAPVIGRVSGDALLLDPRTVLPEEEGMVREALEELRGTIPHLERTKQPTSHLERTKGS